MFEELWQYFNLAILPRWVWALLFLVGVGVVLWLAYRHDRDFYG